MWDNSEIESDTGSTCWATAKSAPEIRCRYRQRANTKPRIDIGQDAPFLIESVAPLRTNDERVEVRTLTIVGCPRIRRP